MIENENNDLILTQIVTRWQIYIDYQKLNKSTRKYHLCLAFIDQMLDRLTEHESYCFLDVYLGYNQIAIALKDQEKRTFTCPCGTFSFGRMSFKLYNALGTF